MNDKEKIEIYEEFLHKINLCCTCCNHDGIRQLVENADRWSYAHRMGEGFSDEKRQKMIDAATRRLTETKPRK